MSNHKIQQQLFKESNPYKPASFKRRCG